MKSRASSPFWKRYHLLPKDIQKIAVKQYRLWLEDHRHPGTTGRQESPMTIVLSEFWTATPSFRFWIGAHAEYDGLIKRKK